MEENDFRKRLKVSIQRGANKVEQLGKNTNINQIQKQDIQAKVKIKIYNTIEKEMLNITNNSNLSKEEKLDGLDLLWDIQKFIEKRDENVKILNEHYRKDKERLD